MKTGKYRSWMIMGMLVTLLLAMTAVTAHAATLTGWQTIDGKSYYYDAEGQLAKSQWILKGSKWYYVNQNGYVVKQISKTSKNAKQYSKVIMVGDSRTLSMPKHYGITSPNVKIIAKSGARYSWLATDAYEAMVDELVDGGKIALVINIGVNDLLNYKTIANFMNTKIMKLVAGEDCDVFFNSVYPVCDERILVKYSASSPRVQKNVIKFNKYMKANLNSKIKYIDMYTYLMKRYTPAQMTLEDGLHYTKSASTVIFDRCLIYLKKGSF